MSFLLTNIAYRFNKPSGVINIEKPTMKLSFAAMMLLPLIYSNPSLKHHTITAKTGTKTAPADSLPGKGMDQHPFLYAGEWQNSSFENQQMFIIRGGKVAWSYTMPQSGEFGDATLLSNGDVIFARFNGASE